MNKTWGGAPSGDRLLILSVLGLLILVSGCSVKQMAINSLGQALSESGDVFASDNDPELIRQALPFSLKMIEALLAESPEHEGLLLAASSGFTQYAYAFVQEDADRLELEDIDASDRLRIRARNLYLRARDYGLRGLTVQHPQLSEQIFQNPQQALAKTTKKEVPLLYWTAVSWAGAINVSRDQPDLIAELPQVDALVDRAMALDPDFENGSLHAFMISYVFARAGGEAEAIQLARSHFERAVTLSEGRLASPYVALAESVTITEQNFKEFKQRLNQALAIDPDAEPSMRLSNILAQQRAQWLLAEADEFFWDTTED